MHILFELSQSKSKGKIYNRWILEILFVSYWGLYTAPRKIASSNYFLNDCIFKMADLLLKSSMIFILLITINAITFLVYKYFPVRLFEEFLPKE